MNEYIHKLIKEQFNINDLDFSDDISMPVNIFSKELYDIEKIYNDMLNSIFVDKDAIEYLNLNVSVFRPKNKRQVRRIIKYYSKIYPDDSLNWLDVSKITNMRELFRATIYKGDISKWDVSNATDMAYMFYESKFNGDISKWNVSKVTNMVYMFGHSSFNNDISMWDVSNVCTMAGMFCNSLFNLDISKWNVSNVKEMDLMFEDSIFNRDISGWDVSNVCFMYHMFNRSPFNQDISGWDVSEVFIDRYPENPGNKDIFGNCPIKEKYKPIQARKFK